MKSHDQTHEVLVPGESGSGVAVGAHVNLIIVVAAAVLSFEIVMFPFLTFTVCYGCMN